MKKIGVINQPISALIAGLGHLDQVVICDAGLPIPSSVMRIDLALVEGIPTFSQTVEAVQREMQVERLIIAEEMLSRSPQVYEFLEKSFPGLPIEKVTHNLFKDLTHHAVAIIRTGEVTPYANVILIAGVTF
jgi:D-ribose pyranase